MRYQTALFTDKFFLENPTGGSPSGPLFLKPEMRYQTALFTVYQAYGTHSVSLSKSFSSFLYLPYVRQTNTSKM
ncbi:hypothetical protein, partial [Vibrio sp.]|uniref:hypothetical protein n=1 Tax=Vibrio sp. TaxID=678 RepID=UPI003D1227D9